MKLKFFLPSISVSIVSLLGINNMANAAYFSPLTGYTKANLAQEINNGSFVEEFNAVSNIGDNGMAAYELELNNIVPPKTVDPASSRQKQFLWKNGEEVDFKLSFDGKTLNYEVGNELLSSVDVNEAGFDINGMILGAQSTENSSSELKDLMFSEEGSPISQNLNSMGGEVDFLKVTGIDNTFTLTGKQVFSWAGARPADFDLAYQIRVGTFQDPVSNQYNSRNANKLNSLVTEEVPEPKTVSFLYLLSVGMLFNLHRR